MAYTYLIGWSKLDKWYYGVRFAKDCHPGDLWKTYFTSSKYVEEYRQLHGEPDVIEIRHTFEDSSAAMLWEQRVLRKMNVLHSEKWLNKNISGAIASEISRETAMNAIKNGTHHFLKLTPETRSQRSRKAAMSAFKNGTHVFLQPNFLINNLKEKYIKMTDEEFAEWLTKQNLIMKDGRKNPNVIKAINIRKQSGRQF